MKQLKVKKTANLVSKAPQSRQLLDWYDRHRRIMPWRALAGRKSDPYRIWLSEVMLQQTTVATVGPYFIKFIERWPRLQDLAKASLDDVLKMWAGLGYYRRARMLYQCAQTLVTEFGGVFPRDEKTLLSLPGFGPYTAAAVAAIAFDRPTNVVDGNVERVMARIFAIQEPMPQAKAKLRALAAPLVPQKRAGDYAQALMDLGATICTPRSPKCGICPWQKNCVAYSADLQEILPRRIKAVARPVRRAMAFVWLNDKGEVLIRKRPSEGLLADMMEIPTSPWVEGNAPQLEDVKDHAPSKLKWKLCQEPVVHVFTHFTFEISVAIASGGKSLKGHWINPKKMGDEALPSVMKKIVHHALKSL